MSYRGRSKPTRPKPKKPSKSQDSSDQTFPSRKPISPAPSSPSQKSFRFQNKKTVCRQEQQSPSLHIDAGLQYLAGQQITHNAEIVYFWDNYRYLKSRQGSVIELVPSLWSVSTDYASKDYERRRAAIVDTMTAICDEFGQYKTLYMAVFLLDVAMENQFSNYLNDKKVEQAGATALFMASKYCQTEPFDINDLIELINPGSRGGPPKLHPSDILAAESTLLDRTNFLLTYDDECSFLALYTIYLHLPRLDFFSCQYILEVGLLYGRLNREHPSLKAVAAIYLNNYLRYMKSDRSYPKELRKLTGYASRVVKSTSEKYMRALILRRQYNLYGSFDKFGGEMFAQITAGDCPF